MGFSRLCFHQASPGLLALGVVLEVVLLDDAYCWTAALLKGDSSFMIGSIVHICHSVISNAKLSLVAVIGDALKHIGSKCRLNCLIFL